MEVVNLKVFVALAFGVPQYGDFQALDLFDGNPADSPSGLERFTGVIEPIFAAQRDVQGGLVFGSQSGG